MQSSEERRTGARMPSLLTPAQQAEADRNRILTKLEHGKADVPPVKGQPSRKAAWGAAAALALALIGGAAFWMTDKPAAAPVVLAAANVAPARAEPPAVRSPEPEAAPAATIHDEPGPAAVAAPAPKVEAEAKPDADELRKALEEGSTVKKAPAHKAAPKAAPKPAPPAVHKAPAHARPDSDLALLSALVAHTQAARSTSDGSAALKKELKACSRLKGSKASDCREEACLGHEGSVAACK